MLIILSITLLVSCSQFPQKAPVVKSEKNPPQNLKEILDDAMEKNPPTIFQKTIRAMANRLFKQAKSHPDIDGQPGTVVFLPLVNANSKMAVKASQPIEQIILEESQKNFNDFTIHPLTPKNLREAQYIINGTLDFENANKDGYHRIFVAMTNHKTGETLAKSTGWISIADLDSTPVPLYQESPMYLTDKPITELIVPDFQVQSAYQEFYGSLDTDTLLTEAESAYEYQEYEKALSLFNIVAKRLPQRQLIRTYANLYKTYLKLNQQTMAEKAFVRLLAVSVKETNKLNVKFLFSQNSTEFVDDEELRDEYSFWIQSIAKYFKSNTNCFNIVGYSNQTETDSQDLSLLRAQKIQHEMQNHLPELTHRAKPVVGKEHSEDINNTDQMLDATTRRVEIMVVNCSLI